MTTATQERKVMTIVKCHADYMVKLQTKNANCANAEYRIVYLGRDIDEAVKCFGRRLTEFERTSLRGSLPVNRDL